MRALVEQVAMARGERGTGMTAALGVGVRRRGRGSLPPAAPMLLRILGSLAAGVGAILIVVTAPLEVRGEASDGRASALPGATQGGTRAAARPGAPTPVRALVVKYRSTGPHALTECADRLSSRGESFQPHLSDRSDSLDQIRRRFGLGHQRAVFRRVSGQPLAAQRAALQQRFERRRAHGPGGPLPDLAPIYRLEVPQGVSPDDLLEALRSDPHVEYAQPDHAHALDQAVSFDDPYLSSAGSWGQPYADLWGPAFVRAPEVWPIAQGEGAVVAVVDTGLDQTHPDIAANLWVNPGEDLDGNGVVDPADENGLDDDGNGFIDDLTGFDFANSVDANADGDFDDPGDVSDADPTDDNGHGTHVTGTIAAVANNGLGIAGIAPRARVMALKGFPASGSASDVVLWRAVLYAAENGATVVNNSWSCGSPCPENPLAEEVLEVVDALGTVVVTSAGNDSTDVAFFSPENGSRVITVGAVGIDRALPAFTNRGWLVDVVAPGGGPDEPLTVPVAERNILSLRASGTRENEPAFIVGGDYLRLAGTSMASPHVAGAVAVLRARDPQLTPAQVRMLVRLSARDLGSPGQDPDYGSGALDLAAMLATDLPDLRLELTSPRVNSTHDPARGPILVRGIADGSDLEGIEVSIARGLSGRTFLPLESFGASRLEGPVGGASEGVLARWDVSAVPDGPYVIRMRARLRDGRSFDEHTIVGIERNAPARLSGGVLDAAEPDLSGEELVWRVAGAGEETRDDDLVLGRFPKSQATSPRGEDPIEQRIELAGDQRSPARDGAELAWLELGDGGRRILQRCRIDTRRRCDPRPVSSASGLFGSPFLHNGWLVWARSDRGAQSVEGCPVGPGMGDCVPRSLIDPATGSDWILHDFDGEWLLVSRPGRFGRCRLDSGAAPCRPVDIVLPSGVSAFEPRLDGDLLAFSRIDVAFRPPPGCGSSDPRPGCAPQAVVLIQYRACAIDPATSFCDPITVSDEQPVERALGVEVSGRRVVWAMGTAEELPALRFCELDPTTKRCPAQRVGGVLASQSEPAIDGNRLAWTDGRSGGVAVYGIALPSLRGPGARPLRAGTAFSIRLDADPGFSPTLRYEVEALAGVTPVEAQARVLDGGIAGGPVLLQGRVPDSASGGARWRIRAVGAGGFSSEHVIELMIRPALRRPTNDGR